MKEPFLSPLSNTTNQEIFFPYRQPWLFDFYFGLVLFFWRILFCFFFQGELSISFCELNRGFSKQTARHSLVLRTSAGQIYHRWHAMQMMVSVPDGAVIDFHKGFMDFRVQGRLPIPFLDLWITFARQSPGAEIPCWRRHFPDCSKPSWQLTLNGLSLQNRRR